jgi:putative FmdB family regulatory protein
MPIYEYTCNAHGIFERLNSMAEKRATEPCPTCGAESDWTISRVSMQPDSFWHGKYSDQFGREFTSKKSYEEAIKSSGLIPKEAGVERDVAQNKKYVAEAEAQARHEAAGQALKQYNEGRRE